MCDCNNERELGQVQVGWVAHTFDMIRGNNRIYHQSVARAQLDPTAVTAARAKSTHFAYFCVQLFGA